MHHVTIELIVLIQLKLFQATQIVRNWNRGLFHTE